VTTSVERLTVNESRAVVEYAPSGNRRTHSSRTAHRRSLLVEISPGRGYTVGDTETLGVWRYYTSRETRWDTLAGLWYQQFGSPITVATTASTRLSGEQDGAKTKHPARVTNVDGEVADPPTLPESIDVDVVSTPYTTSETVITTGQPAFFE